jgi:zinc transport system permease protein
MDDFLVMAIIAGIGVALIAGPLGCFVVWRRMSYFGAALSHSALLGVALGFLLDISPLIGIVGICFAIALALAALERDKHFSTDTILGILAHGMLAAGLIAIGFLDNVRIDLMAYLFGDILAVNSNDLMWIWGAGAGCLLTLALIWRGLVSMSVHEELAQVEGVPVTAFRTIFMIIIAMVIAMAMKVVGVLLIVSLLIIPAAAARRFSKTPEAMAVLAAIIGVVSVIGGIMISSAIDTPAGPSIVMVATALFFVTLIGRKAAVV